MWMSCQLIDENDVEIKESRFCNHGIELSENELLIEWNLVINDQESTKCCNLFSHYHQPNCCDKLIK